MSFFDYRSVQNPSDIPEGMMDNFKYNKILDGFMHTLTFYMEEYEKFAKGEMTAEALAESMADHVAMKGLLVAGLMAIRENEREIAIDNEVAKFGNILNKDL